MHIYKCILHIPKYHTMKTYRRVQVQLCVFLNSAVDGGEWSDSRSSHFTPEKLPGGLQSLFGHCGTKNFLPLLGYCLFLRKRIIMSKTFEVFTVVEI